MNVFISGTDTDVGKTIVSSWIALHTGFAYFKPIQTGAPTDDDTREVERLSDCTVYPSVYRYAAPLSPHLAAKMEGDRIDLENIFLPTKNNCVVEGAGGVLVPINETCLMIDLIKKLRTPVLLVARSGLGTLNHTLLSLEALRARAIEVLGVIMNGLPNPENKQALEFYGSTRVLAEVPFLPAIYPQSLQSFPLPTPLRQILLRD